MERKWKILLGVLGILTLVIILSFIILPKTSFAIYQDKAVDKTYLENLKLKANVECLQNSQCLEGFECVGNKCLSKNSIDLCKDLGLSTPSRKLKIGDSINSIKSIITEDQLPYLLPDGKIIEIENNELIEHFYTQVILIGYAQIKKENEDYVIKTSEPIYTYRLMFSNSVDFSSNNIAGQVLRILGNEYVIDSKSDNSRIILVSNKKLKLEDGKKANDIVKGSLVNIKRNEEEKVIMLEILFNMQDKDKGNIKVKENYSDPVFNAIKLSFDNANDEFADVRLGGNC